jgi:hypothetical protein
VISVDEIRSAINNPNLAIQELNRGYYTSFNRRKYNKKGIKIMDENWDNLIILDGCRLDVFKEYADLPGETDSKISRGSSTVEFLRGNLSGESFSDTVYITANPQYYKHDFNSSFHYVENVWKEDGWDEEFGTVLPEAMKKYTLGANKEYPNKRIIAHFMQPHYPFVNSGFDDDKGHLTGDKKSNIWLKLAKGESSLSRSEVWAAYISNLELVLPTVEELIEIFDGKTIVTSDHGNLVGEEIGPIPTVGWGHPSGLYVNKLVQVPWHIYEQGEKEIIPGDISTVEQIDENKVRDRLENLGYI